MRKTVLFGLLLALGSIPFASYGQDVAITSVTGTPECEGLAAARVVTVELSNSGLSLNGVTINAIADGGATESKTLSGNASTLSVQILPVHGSYFNHKIYVYIDAVGGDTDLSNDTMAITFQDYRRATPGFNVAQTCDGDASIFTNTSIAPGPFTSAWAFRDATYSTSDNPIHTYSGPGTYLPLLTVTTSDGCVDTANRTHTVHPRPVASFTATDACDGSPASFTNNTTITAGTWTNHWSYRDATYSTAANPTHTFPGLGTYQVLLTATSDQGCVGQTTVPVTVNPNPVADFTATEACNMSVTSFVNQTYMLSGSYTSSWTFGDGNISNASSPTHTYSTDGPKSVTMTSTSALGCTDMITKSVNVWPIPSAEFTATDACDGDAVTFNNTSSVSSGTFNSSWNFRDGTSGLGVNPVHTYPGVGAYDVILTNTSNNGCVSTVENTVYVNANPVASFNVAGVCLGTKAAFNNTSTITSGTIYSSWTFGDGGSSNATTPSYAYSGPGLYTVNLNLVSDKGCTDAATDKIRVSSNPVASFTPNNACESVATSFVNTSTVAEGTITSYWRFGDGNISTVQSPTHTYPGDGNYIVELTVTSNEGCTNTTSQVITMYPTPVAAFEVGSVCDGVAADFINKSYVAQGNIASNEWAFRDATYSSDENPSHVFAGVQIYNVLLTVTSNQGCKASIEKPVSVYANPVAEFTTRDVCDGVEASFSNQSSVVGVDVVNSSFWDFGDSRISYAYNPTHLYFNPGTYNVTMTALSNRGCTGSTTKSITIHPNPVADFTVANVCQGFDIAPVNLSTGADSYYWTFGDSYYSSDMSPTHYYNRAETFPIRLVATSAFGCTDDVTKEVTIYEKPVIYSSGDTSVSKGLSVGLSTWSSLPGTFLWDPANVLDDASSQTPVATLDNTTTFTVETTTGDGCKDTTSLTVTAIPDYIVFPTNIITLNNDGTNDVLAMGNLYNYPNNNLIIFDRWGREVYNKDMYTGDWGGVSDSGNDLPSGTYYYILTFDMNEDVVYKGAVTIVRTN